MPRNYRNALQGIAPKGVFNRIGNFGRKLLTRKAQVAPEESRGVPRVYLNALGTPSTTDVVSENLGDVESKQRSYQENFEQTFIKESIADVANNLDISTFSTSVLKEYSTRLRSSRCSEIEAVYLYDRLISILIILSYTGLFYSMSHKQYSAISSQFHVGVNPEIEDRLKRKISEVKLGLPNIEELLIYITSSYSGFGSFLAARRDAPLAVTTAMVSGLASGVASGLWAEAAAAAGVGAAGAAAAGAAPALILGLAFVVIFSLKLGDNFNEMTLRMFIKAQNVLKIMFSRENTVRIEKLKGKLKFWNLPKSAVKYMFNIGLTGRQEGEGLAQRALENSTQDKCAICRAPYTEEPDKVTSKLRCGHKLHEACVQGWFKVQDTQKRQHSCPICRAEVSDVTLLSTDNKNFSEMNDKQFKNYILNMLHYMSSPYERRTLSNRPFTQELMDYKYTMYNTTKVYGKTEGSFWIDPTPSLARAQKRKDAWKREQNLANAELDPRGSRGGRRRTKKRSTSRRRSRSSLN